MKTPEPRPDSLLWNDPKGTRRLASYVRPERRAALAERKREVSGWLTPRHKGVGRALASFFGL